jgi:hypothetical protein
MHVKRSTLFQFASTANAAAESNLQFHVCLRRLLEAGFYSVRASFAGVFPPNTLMPRILQVLHQHCSARQSNYELHFKP